MNIFNNIKKEILEIVEKNKKKLKLMIIFQPRIFRLN